MASSERRAEKRREDDEAYERRSMERDRREAAWQARWGALEAKLEALGIEPSELHDWANSDRDAREV